LLAEFDLASKGVALSLVTDAILDRE